MKLSFTNIFRSQSKPVPGKVKKELKSQFPEAINIDWEQKGSMYEAIFYVSDVEHIARFTEEGELLEYKKNLWPEELPGQIAEEAAAKGEIMNVIAIYRGEIQLFEVIIRDKEFNRTLLIFDRNAALMETRRI